MTDQEKREKVIKGLECYIPMTERNGVGDCRNCPYDRKITLEGGVTECCHDLMTDALALLKAQEPRVMTQEEVEQWNQPDVWMENRDSEPDICGEYMVPMTRMEYAFWHAIIVDGSKHPPIINGDFYGKTWRCWTSRPTDEQREAVKWE